MKFVIALIGLAAFPALTPAGRIFVLADDQGERHRYATHREDPRPAAEAEAELFAGIAGALARDRGIAVPMFAQDQASLERAERVLSARRRQSLRRIAIRRQAGPLGPVILYGQREP